MGWYYEILRCADSAQNDLGGDSVRGGLRGDSARNDLNRAPAQNDLGTDCAEDDSGTAPAKNDLGMYICGDHGAGGGSYRKRVFVHGGYSLRGLIARQG
jgi:hypothetical protein